MLCCCCCGLCTRPHTHTHNKHRIIHAGVEDAATAAAGDIHYCFGMKGEPLDSVTAGNRQQMEVRGTSLLALLRVRRHA
jgi:hypothetical protein